jgi:hypothetical protein
MKVRFLSAGPGIAEFALGGAKFGFQPAPLLGVARVGREVGPLKRIAS